MDIADLVVWSRLALTPRFMGAFHQPCAGEVDGIHQCGIHLHTGSDHRISEAHALRVHAGHGKHAAAKKGCNLLRVDFVVLGFPAVDGFHVQGVAEHEGGPFPTAQIGDPVPGEDTLHRHRDILSEWGDRFQKCIGTRLVVPVQENLTRLVHDAEEHRSCVQVDAAVELMLMRVESH